MLLPLTILFAEPLNLSLSVATDFRDPFAEEGEEPSESGESGGDSSLRVEFGDLASAISRRARSRSSACRALSSCKTFVLSHHKLSTQIDL